MKIALASKEFINKDIQENILTIRKTMIDAKNNKADMICFGEAFLQGFDSLSWNYERDKAMAVNVSSTPIQTLCNDAKDVGIALTFGWFEIEGEEIYCSYMVISDEGQRIFNYRRISSGWRTNYSSEDHYKESKSFSTFNYKDKTFLVGLCGDFWDDTNIKKVCELKKDIILWPLYVTFGIEEFENEHKSDYTQQASKLNSRVLLINSRSKNPWAFGGCYEFKNGEVIHSLNIGEEGLLYIEV